MQIVDVILQGVGFDAAAATTGAQEYDRASDKIAGSSKKAEQETEKANKTFDEMRVSLGRLVTPITVGAAAVAGLALGFNKLSSEAAEAELVLIRFDAIARATGQQAGQTGLALEKAAQALASGTLASIEQARSVAGILATFGGVRDNFQEILILAQDLSSATGRDLTEQVRKLGRAMEDPVNRMGELSESGVLFTNTEKELVKVLVENNDLLGARSVILDKVAGKAGGVAKAETEGLAGAMDDLGLAASNAFENLVKIGAELTGAEQGFRSLAGSINETNDELEAFSGSLEGKIKVNLRAIVSTSERLKEIRDREAIATGVLGIGPKDQTSALLERQLALQQANNRELERQISHRDRLAALEQKTLDGINNRTKAQQAADAAQTESDKKRAKAAEDAGKVAAAALKAENDLKDQIFQKLSASNDARQLEVKLLGVATEEQERVQILEEINIELRQAGITLTLSEITAIEMKVDAYVGYGRTLEVVAEAEKKRADAVKAEAVAAKEATDARIKAADELAKAEQDAREFAARPFLNALDDAQLEVTNFFQDFLDGGIKSFGDLADSFKSIFTRLLADLAAARLFQPIANSIADSVFGTVGGGGGFGGTGVGFGGGPPGFGGGFGDILGIGNDLSSVFSGLTGGVTSIGNSIGNFFGFAGTAGAPGNAIGTGLGGATGAEFGGSGFLQGGLGANLGPGLAGGALGGLASGALGLGGNNQLVNTGLGAAGSLAGGALGSFFGPVGTFAGSFLGNIAGNALGGLFGPGETVGPLGFSSFGLNEAGGVKVVDSNVDNRGDREAAEALGNAVTGQVNAILGALGGDAALGNFGSSFQQIGFLGANQDTPFFFNPSNQGIREKSGANFENVQFETAEEAISFTTAQILRGITGVAPEIKRAIEIRADADNATAEGLLEGALFARNFQDAITSLSGGVETFSESIVAQADERIGALADSLNEFRATTEELELSSANAEGAIARFGDILIGLTDSAEDSLSPIEAAVEAINATFDAIIDNAETFNLGASRIEEGRASAIGQLGTDFAQGFADALDPSGAAVRQIGDQLDQAIADAATLGISDPTVLANIQTYYDGLLVDALGGEGGVVEGLLGVFDPVLDALQDQRGEAQSLADTYRNLSTSIGDFRQSLLLSADSPLSPAARFAESGAQLDRLTQRALSGDPEALGQITGAAGGFLQSARGFLGVSAFAGEFERVQGILASVEATSDLEAVQAESQIGRLDTQIGILEEIAGNTAAAAQATGLQSALFSPGSSLSGDLVSEGSFTRVTQSGLTEARRNAVARGLGFEGEFGGGQFGNFLAANPGFAAEFDQAVDIRTQTRDQGATLVLNEGLGTLASILSQILQVNKDTVFALEQIAENA